MALRKIPIIKLLIPLKQVTNEENLEKASELRFTFHEKKITTELVVSQANHMKQVAHSQVAKCIPGMTKKG